MNPKNNNPLSNPFATGDTTGAAGNPDPTPSMSGMSLSNNLTAAQNDFMSTTTPNPNNAMGFDQTTTTDTDPTVSPFSSEPLVPAAPVPGSIGSAISMPPADPIAAPASVAPAAPAPVDHTPYNPFATPAPETPATPPAPTAPAASPAPAAPTIPPAPTAPNAPASPITLGTIEPHTPTTDPTAAPHSAPAVQPAPASDSASDSAHSAPAVQPMPVSSKSAKTKTKKPHSQHHPLTIIFGVTTLAFLILSIVLFALWNNEKKNLKPIYYPISENTSSTLKSISCQRNETRENPNATGKTITTISFTNNNLSAYSSNLSLDFANEADAANARNANASTAESLAGIIGGSLTVSNTANGNNFTYNITSQDGTTVAASDAQTAIYGTTEGNPSLALFDVQTKLEADGYVCTEE